MAVQPVPIIPSELPLAHQIEFHCTKAFRESFTRIAVPEVTYERNRRQCIEEEGIPLLLKFLNEYFHRRYVCKHFFLFIYIYIFNSN